MAALWWRIGFLRVWAVIGVVCGLMIIVWCASSTPISSVVCGVLGACFFAARRHMRAVRWTVFGLLVVLHLVMQAPVWHLVARIDLVGGSTGWHRFNLINQFILRVNEWWLLGVKSVESWGVVLGDITNQYILEGVRGGSLALALFVALIIMAFSRARLHVAYEDWAHEPVAKSE